MTQTAIISQSKRIQRRMERLFLAKVYKALQMQIKAFTRDMRLNGLNYAKGRLTTDILNSAVGPVIQQIYRLSAITNANNVYREQKSMATTRAKSSIGESLLGENLNPDTYTMQLKYRGFGFNEKWTEEVNTYFRLHLLEKAVVPISNTTKEFILRLLQKATEEGWTVEQVVKELETSDITKNRARTIVRTETVRATNFGGMLGAFESTLEMEKEWIDANDFRVRRSHSHAGVAGEKRDLLKPFSNGLMFPGDPEGSAKETINCRCVLGFTPKRDRNGRLIKKPVPVQGIRTSLVDVMGGLAIGINIGQQLADFINDN